MSNAWLGTVEDRGETEAGEGWRKWWSEEKGGLMREERRQGKKENMHHIYLSSPLCIL